jgi:hypothetical protein
VMLALSHFALISSIPSNTWIMKAPTLCMTIAHWLGSKKVTKIMSQMNPDYLKSQWHCHDSTTNVRICNLWYDLQHQKFVFWLLRLWWTNDTTTHFGFCNWPLQLHTSQKGHMWLVNC